MLALLLTLPWLRFMLVSLTSAYSVAATSFLADVQGGIMETPWSTIAIAVITSGFLLGVLQLFATRKERAASADATSVQTANDLVALLREDANQARELFKQERAERLKSEKESQEKITVLREKVARLEQQIIDSEQARKEIALLQMKLAACQDARELLEDELAQLRNRRRATDDE